MIDGYCFVGSLSPAWVTLCNVYAEMALDRGSGFHAIVTVPDFVELIEKLNEEVFPEVRNHFNSPFIINSFSVLNNTPGKVDFSSEYHRDLRFFTGEVPMMFNMIIMLDDFTEENGATWVIPGSHLSKISTTRAPVQVTGNAGDILLFNSNLLHKAGFNTTDRPRRAIAITLSKSCMKQLLDYPRALGDIQASEEIKQLLGYHSRVPASIEEWEGERTYKKDQD